MVLSVFAGAIAGIVHVISGPDHLAAVAPLSLNEREQAWGTGFRWGMGHSFGVFLVGLLSLALREALPVDRFSSSAERLVGLVLVGIGIWGFSKTCGLRKRGFRWGRHKRAGDHVHAGEEAGDVAGTEQTESKRSRWRRGHTAVAVGTLHGVAGSSHFLGILPALALPTRLQAISYLVAYGVGTILTMATFASTVGWVAGRLTLSGAAADKVLMSACSGAAVIVGTWWLTMM